jgi:hypothetical protein
MEFGNLEGSPCVRVLQHFVIQQLPPPCSTSLEKRRSGCIAIDCSPFAGDVLRRVCRPAYRVFALSARDMGFSATTLQQAMGYAKRAKAKRKEMQSQGFGHFSVFAS